MKICVFGAGAIGGHLAARLAKGGAEVSVVARGAYLDAIRTRGLTVRALDGEHHCRPAASADPAELGPQDAVIVTTKAPALTQVAGAIGPLLGPETAVAFVMNGIPWWYFDRHGGELDGRRLPALDPDDAVRRAIGVERTIGGVVHSSCTVVEPGVVEVTNKGSRVILGEPDGSLSNRARAIANLFRGGGILSSVVPDIRAEIWSKLLGNISYGPLCVLSREAGNKTFDDPATVAAAERMMREGFAIAESLGVHFELGMDKRLSMLGASAHKPSILQDLELGRPMEIDALMTVPLELARLRGVETPTLDLLVALTARAAAAAGLYRMPGR
ncbi:ketopantoate reductase family protein [Roseomonas elaeocarpi]|uniref:2-dehydropantoate 2-reductase n=1 Tax=Roseomonas elaeocarpi TaxID=907779 RepID=A0ABV6JQQ0_9PROT